MLTMNYFDCYGRAEPGRMMLNMGGANFTDRRIKFEDWPNIKPNAPFNGRGAPVVVGPGNKIMPQSKALYLHFSRKLGFYPMNDFDLALVNDWIMDTYYDYYGTIAAPALAAVSGGSPEEIQQKAEVAL